MKYLLDTNILSYVARDASALLTARVMGMAADDMAISVVTRGEIEFGLLKRTPSRLTLARMQGLLSSIETLGIPPTAADHYRDMRYALERSGTPIGNNDLWIAAHALAEARTLVTNNEREFDRVPGLRVENWLR